MIFYNVKDELDVFCICGTSKMWIYVSASLRIRVDEHLCNELSSLHVVTLWTYRYTRSIQRTCTLQPDLTHCQVHTMLLLALFTPYHGSDLDLESGKWDHLFWIEIVLRWLDSNLGKCSHMPDSRSWSRQVDSDLDKWYSVNRAIVATHLHQWHMPTY